MEPPSTSSHLSNSTDNANETNVVVGLSDEAFEAWLTEQLDQHPLQVDFPAVFAAAPKCIVQWRKRFRGDRALWQRLFQKDRVLKEFIEAAPIIDAVQRLVAVSTSAESSSSSSSAPYTIVDLASGRGYLSMILSELLSPGKVRRCVLVDKAWPCHDVTPQPHHINWSHIYGQITTGDGSSPPRRYYDTWPIPLSTCKVDLKNSSQRRKLERHCFSDGPVILLAIHLCGTLSLKAIELFNRNASVELFCLKPCCLPGMVHVKRKEVFQAGSHSFDAKTVCMEGKWKKNKWHGPPRHELKGSFQRWAYHLYCGMEGGNHDGDVIHEVRKLRKTVRVQTDGGYQNEFLFAERLHASECVEEGMELPGQNELVCHEVASKVPSDQ